MIVDSVKFRGHGCFKDEWSGFDVIKPINVIIGRNNSGKSHLIDLIAELCAHPLTAIHWPLLCKGTLDEDALKIYFSKNTNGGMLNGNHWNDHGLHFVGLEMSWEMTGNNKFKPIFPEKFDVNSRFGVNSTQSRLEILRALVTNQRHQFLGKTFRRLLADRDVNQEKPDNNLALGPDGHGATNIIRRFIHTSNVRYPREVIQRELLDGLNTIFGKDGHFNEIQAKEHDEPAAGQSQGHWEIYLGEAKKGLIPLSRSGSGLKTVILVLLNLLVIPKIEQKGGKKNYVFAFEELENNLHPALLRRLFQYLEAYAVREEASIFLTTHSSVALDLFGLSKNAQIIHVTHNGESAKVQTVSAHFDHLGVISELGAKPSDLLQANGIIWVEGPSDCIYLNRWIDLLSDKTLQEGRDYLCAFYGGSLLARTQFTSPEDAEKELVNLFRVNPNIVVVCDGDRASKGARVKDRVRRIRAEVLKIPNAHIWVTDAREIENYIPGSVLAEASELSSVPDPDKYELFFPKKNHPGESYIEKRLNRKSLDKMDLAVVCAPKMDKAMMDARFEWKEQISQIVEKIRNWNR